MNKKGLGLIVAIFIIVLLASLGVVGAAMFSSDAELSMDTYRSIQAFYVAEAGLQDVYYQLKTDEDFRDSPTTVTETIGNGTYSVTVTKDDDTYTLTSTGTVGSVVTRKITETVTTASGVLMRTIHADGNSVKFDGSSGTIDGNVSCFGSVLPDPLPAGLTVTGDVTDSDDDQPKVNPSITMSTYQTLAAALGQSSTSNLTFSSGNTYTGIWYTTKNATIQSNVTINGTVVAKKKIEFKTGKNNSTNVTINPKAYDATQNYPALVSGTDITSKVKSGTGLANSTINGLVLADKNITFDNMTGTTFTGTIIAGKKLSLQNGTLNIIYNEDIFTPPILGFTYTAGDAAVEKQNDWEETF